VYLFGLLCFYTTASTGVRWARGALTDLFSGALVPITFFTPAMLAVSRVLPFQGIVFYTGFYIYGYGRGYSRYFELIIISGSLGIRVMVLRPGILAGSGAPGYNRRGLR